MTRLILPTVILIIGAASSALAAPVSSSLPESTWALQNCVPPEHTQAGSQACVATNVIQSREFRTTELAISESLGQRVVYIVIRFGRHWLNMVFRTILVMISLYGRVTLAKRTKGYSQLTKEERQAVFQSRSQRDDFDPEYDDLDEEFLHAEDWDALAVFRQTQAEMEETIRSYQNAQFRDHDDKNGKYEEQINAHAKEREKLEKGDRYALEKAAQLRRRGRNLHPIGSSMTSS
ncbi:hypothetical protein EV361DRAFT_873188 [Lentinula raphanica]|nr:hypothetical protein EV361DRAFT_873188 [Lentinula raphanica]